MEEKSLLGHERLSIYPISIEFIEWITKNIFKNLAGDSKIADQLSRASSSIPLNIAEGSGKLTEKDKKRFYSIARGSAMECSAIFDVMLARELITENDTLKARQFLMPIIGVLSKLCSGQQCKKKLKIRAKAEFETKAK